MTRASSFLCFVALLSTALPVSPALADTKVRGKYTASGQVWESVVHTKGLRQLYEYENDMAVIEQPDLKRMIQQEADARKKECDYIVQAEIADLHRQLPKVKKGMMAMGAGMMPGIGKYEAKLEYRLLVPGQRSPKMASSVVTKSGTAGSGWKTALNVGLTAGSMALAMQGMGGLSPGMLGMYRMSPGLAALGLGRAMRFDPRVLGLSSTLGGLMGGGMLGQIGMRTGVPGLAGLPMAGFGGNAAASSFIGIAPMLMQLMASGEGFATAGSMDGLVGMGAGSQSQEMFDDGGTIAEALQKVAKAVVSQVRK